MNKTLISEFSVCLKNANNHLLNAKEFIKNDAPALAYAEADAAEQSIHLAKDVIFRTLSAEFFEAYRKNREEKTK